MATNLSNSRFGKSQAARALAQAYPANRIGKNWPRSKRDRNSDDIEDYIGNHPDYVRGTWTTPKGNTYGWFPVKHENIAATLGNAALRAYKNDGFVVKVKVDPETGDPELVTEHMKA